MYNKKKALTLLLFLSLIIIFSASALAAVPGPGEILSDIGDFLRDLLGSSSNLDGNNPSVLAGMRIIWFLLVFTVLYAGGRALQNVAALAQVYNHRIIVVLALLLSAMTLLVTPPTFLIGLAEVYGSIIITVLLSEISAITVKYFTVGFFLWFPSIKTSPGLTTTSRPG